MLYSPVSLFPKNQAIDATIINNFSWQISGSQPDSYRLYIYNNSTGTLIYDSTKITTTNNFCNVPANTLTNSVGYKWYVINYQGASSASSQYEFITASASPTISFTTPTFPSPVVPSQDYLFVCNYSQAQSISIKTYRFILYDSTGTNIIEDSGIVYGFSPQYTMTGMLRSATYQIECQVVSQDNLSATTGKQTFSIASFTLPASTPQIDVENLRSIGAIQVSWQDLRQVLGVVTGSSSYVSGKFNLGLQLTTGSTFDLTTPIPDIYTFTYWIKLSYGQNGDFMKLDSTIAIGYDNTLNKFYYRNGAITLYSQVITLFTLEDFGTKTWADLGTSTLADPNFVSTDLMYNWIFLGFTENNLVIKIHDEIRAQI